MEHTCTVFSEQLNTRFWLRLENGGREPLELVQCQNGLSPPGRDQFSLLFRGRRDTIFPQGTYAVEHQKLGGFDLFLVPVRQTPEGALYEAVFNRLREPPKADSR